MISLMRIHSQFDMHANIQVYVHIHSLWPVFLPRQNTQEDSQKAGLLLLSVAVINTTIRNNLGMEGSISSSASVLPLLGKPRQELQRRRNPESGSAAEATEELLY